MARNTWGKSLDARVARDREQGIDLKESLFQRFQWDKTISRPRKNLSEHMPCGFISEVGGNKTIGWVLQQKLGKLRRILLDFREGER